MSTSYLNRLGAIDFSRTIERLAEGFTGREWLFDKLDDWLQQEDGEMFYLLTGEPGVGKSAIAAQLTQRWADENPVESRLAAYHFCRAGDVETVRPGRVLRSLATQLGKTLPHYGEALKEVLDQVHVRIDVNINIDRLSNSQVTGIYVENLKDLDPREEFRLLIQAPLTALSKIYTTRGETPPALKVFLIDSLDEAATTTGQENMVTLLASLYQAQETLPPWVRFLLTARPDRSVLNRFLPLQSQKIEELEAKNLSDIQRYVQGRVDEQFREERSTPKPQTSNAIVTNPKSLRQRLAEAELTAEKLVGEVKELSHGNFLYTKLLLNSIASGEQSIKNLSALPKDLNEIYHRILRYRCSFRGWLKRYQPILGTLSVTQEPISQAQLGKFTRIDAEELEKNLAVFRQFLDESKDEQGQPLYAIFHQSLREYLLDRKHNHDFWCDAKEQHDGIIQCFENESEKWQDLKAIDLYGLRHLAQHLVKGDRAEELHMLLKLEHNNQNAWFDAKDISSYQADIRLAWEQTAKESLSPRAIALQFHYTLITASLNSLAVQIPLELLVAAVQYEQWSPEKGISYALQIPDPQQKVTALTQLSPYLPPALKTQSLQTAIEILSLNENEQYKAEAFTRLVVELTPELLSKALDFALFIESKNYFKVALSALAPYLNPELLFKALRIFFTSQPYRVEILTALSPHFSRGNLWSTAFESIPFIQDNETRSDALLQLAQELPIHAVEEEEFLWTGILEVILSILGGEIRSKALAFLAPIVPVNHLERVLEIALTTWYFPKSKLLRIEYDSQVLEAIAPRLSPELISKVLNIEIFKEHVNANIKNFKLNISERITQNHLTRLNKTLDELVDRYTWDLPEKTYAQVISTLAPYLNLTSNLFPQVVKTLLDNCIDEALAEALTALVPYYPKALEPAYAAAQGIRDTTSRTFALIELVPYLPNTTLKVLEESFKEIEVPEVRQTALDALIPYLSEAFFHTLQAAIQIEDESFRYPAVLSMQASYISVDCLSLILELASSFESKIWQDVQSIRAKVLIHFLPYLPELFPVAWETVLGINGGRSFTGGVRDEDSRVLTTREFISVIPPELISQALDKAVSIQNEPDEGRYITQSKVENDFEKAFILEMLAPRLTSDLLPKALKAALRIVKFENRELALSALACALPESFPLELEVLKNRNNLDLFEEDKRRYELRLRSEPKLSITAAVSSLGSGTNFLKAMIALAPCFPGVIFCGDSHDKLRLIQSVAPYLDEEHLIKAITIASETKDTQDKVNTLLEISKHLSSEQQYRILEVLQKIEERYCSQALIDLIPYLPENLFEKVLFLAMSISDEYRLPVLVALIPYISEALSNALVSVSSVRDYYGYSQSLLETSKYLSDFLCKEVLDKALKIALNIPQSSLERVSALVNLVPHIQDSVSHALDAAINHKYSSVHLHNYLETLAPYLGETDLVTAFEAAKQLDSFGSYKYKALMALSPYFPKSIFELKNAILSEGYIGTFETIYLVKLAPVLSGLIPDAIKAVFSHSDSQVSDFIGHLEKLIPHLNAEHMFEALNRTQSLSIWSRAFALKILLQKLSFTHPKVYRKLASKYSSESVPFSMKAFQNRSWIKFLEKIRIWQKNDSEIFFKAQKILESIQKEAELFYVYPLTELSRNLECGLIRNAIDKPLLWDFTREIIDIFIKGMAPYISQEFLSELLEDDPSVALKAAFADYAIRQRRHASVFLAPYMSPILFEKALEISMLVDDSDRAKILKALIPKLPKNQLLRARKILESIESSKERSELLIIYTARCPHILIEVLQIVFSLSLRDGRTERLNDILPYLQQIPITNLFCFWTKSLESLFPCSRAEVFGKIDILAPVAQQLGGDEAIEALTDSIDCVTRWWR